MPARIAFYFDLVGFRSQLEPLLAPLQRHDLSALRQVAQAIGHSQPAVWERVGYFGHYADELGHEETEYDTELGRLHFWMMILACHYCRPVPGMAGAVATLDALRGYALGQGLFRELWLGRPFGALLLPEIEHRTAEQWAESGWPYWAQGYGLGWLDQADMRRLIPILTAE